MKRESLIVALGVSLMLAVGLLWWRILELEKTVNSMNQPHFELVPRQADSE